MLAVRPFELLGDLSLQLVDGALINLESGQPVPPGNTDPARLDRATDNTVPCWRDQLILGSGPHGHCGLKQREARTLEAAAIRAMASFLAASYE
ncbi:hypothetical protein GCM10010324_03720 [Streptomyces hiroshimensis]|uniref:Uncharacterized protein n=1 Tax=Streptomyces hiroshimensis TaxID=66424 RepID=A0ABQ2Y3P0_9ACTN|nr:hypothetical protein GCM10010324_03720 [Streptomyces hiroshimensis]